MDHITIKSLTSGHELDQAVELQKIYWGQDASNLVPRNVLLSFAKHGGHLIGAYEDDRLIGFVMGFMGMDTCDELKSDEPAASRLLLMSKRMLVLPDHRGKNLGFRLKQAQRRIALELGIGLVTWTFDPLLALNAHFNIRKLGARIVQYEVDYFDLNMAPESKTDRLVVHWRVSDRRAQDCADGITSRTTLSQILADGAQTLNCADLTGAWPTPATRFISPVARRCLLEIPVDIDKMESSAPNVACLWREHVRQVFPKVLEAGYAVSDFVQDDIDGHRRTFYVLDKQ